MVVLIDDSNMVAVVLFPGYIYYIYIYTYSGIEVGESLSCGDFINVCEWCVVV